MRNTGEAFSRELKFNDNWHFGRFSEKILFTTKILVDLLPTSQQAHAVSFKSNQQRNYHMSTPNPSESSSDKAQDFELNENGELVVKNPDLAQALEELNSEELDEIAGGGGGTNTCPVNVVCKPQ
jgi:hypothetical protein